MDKSLKFITDLFNGNATPDDLNSVKSSVDPSMSSFIDSYTDIINDMKNNNVDPNDMGFNIPQITPEKAKKFDPSLLSKPMKELLSMIKDPVLKQVESKSEHTDFLTSKHNKFLTPKKYQKPASKSKKIISSESEETVFTLEKEQQIVKKKAKKVSHLDVGQSPTSKPDMSSVSHLDVGQSPTSKPDMSSVSPSKQFFIDGSEKENTLPKKIPSTNKQYKLSNGFENIDLVINNNENYYSHPNHNSMKLSVNLEVVNNEIVIDFKKIKNRYKFFYVRDFYVSFDKIVELDQINYFMGKLLIDSVKGSYAKIVGILHNDKYIVRLNILQFHTFMIEPFLSDFMIKIKLSDNNVKSRFIFDAYYAILHHSNSICRIMQFGTNYFYAELSEAALGREFKHYLNFKNIIEFIIILTPENKNVSLELEATLKHGNKVLACINNDTKALMDNLETQYVLNSRKLLFNKYIYNIYFNHDMRLEYVQVVTDLVFSYNLSSVNREKTGNIKLEIFAPSIGNVLCDSDSYVFDINT